MKVNAEPGIQDTEEADIGKMRKAAEESSKKDRSKAEAKQHGRSALHVAEGESRRLVLTKSSRYPLTATAGKQEPCGGFGMLGSGEVGREGKGRRLRKRERTRRWQIRAPSCIASMPPVSTSMLNSV